MDTDVRAPTSGDDRLPVALVRAMRPRQWSKQVLLFAAPGAAGVLLDATVLARVAVAALLWSVAASGVYLLNDVLDADDDRRHPTKRHRPVASGALPASVAASVGAVLSVGAVAVSAVMLSAWFALVLGLYVGLTVAYSLGLKRLVLIDLAVVAAGFVLRAIGGGVAAQVEISGWFLIVASFGSLFIVTGKRHAERSNVGTDGTTRPVLSAYTQGLLQTIRLNASAVTILAYCLWAFDEAAPGPGALWFELSILPFVLGIFRYGLLLEAGAGEAPEELVARDRPLQLAGLAWAALFAVGVYAR